MYIGKESLGGERRRGRRRRGRRRRQRMVEQSRGGEEGGDLVTGLMGHSIMY
jgi:hypothetical protein